MSEQPMNHGTEPVNVLAVDDVPENLIALEALLARPGLRVMTARSATEALERLLAHEIAVALVDVQMPGMDGFELAEVMRSSPRTREVPIIFVTAAPRDSGRVFQGYETGAVDFLYKPLDPHVLRSKVDVFVSLAEQRQQLARQVALLEQALRVNETFVGVLGHDLRNPLSAILTGAGVLARRASDDLTRNTAERIQRGGRRMARMIESLLCFARARAGQPVIVTPAPTDVREILASVLDDLSPPEVARVEVEWLGPTNGVWDADRLVQTLTNLVGNALRHGEREQPVRVRVDGTADEHIGIDVHNAGCIAPALLPEIFEPFRSSAEQRGGLGLGLFIVRTFVEAHGGTVTVSSTSVTGTRFSIALPRIWTAPTSHTGPAHAGQGVAQAAAD